MSKYSGVNSPANIAKERQTQAAAKSAALTKLSDTQAFVLNAAADHPQGRLEAFPDSVKGGARAKVIEGLTTRGWIKASGSHLKITKAGFAAIDREKPTAKVDVQNDDAAPAEKAPKAPRAPKAEKPVKVKAPSKQDTMIDLLKQEGGVALTALMEATGWQQHSVRGALSTLNKNLGGTIHSAKRDGARFYWIGELAASSDEADQAPLTDDPFTA